MVSMLPGQHSISPALAHADRADSPEAKGARLVQMPPAADGSLDDMALSRNMFRIYTMKALDDKLMGDTSAYHELQNQFTANAARSDAPSTAHLQSLLLALMHDVSRLDNTCYDLVSAILSCLWIGRSEEFVGVYIRFLGTLTSAHTSYSHMVLRNLVAYFSFISKKQLQVPGHKPVTRDVVQTRAHIAIQYVLELVPSSRSILFPILAREFPYKSEPIRVLSSYVGNLLRIADMLPNFRGQILCILIEKIIQIDVEIQVELDDLPEADDLLKDLNVLGDTKFAGTSRILARLADAYDDDDGEDDDDNDNDDGKADEASLSMIPDDTIEESDTDDMGDDTEAIAKTVKELVSKLDVLMAQMFEYLHHLFDEQSAARDVVFDYMMTSFTNTILPTFRSRYTQFILFWMSQHDGNYTDIFLGTITEIALDPARPRSLRIVADMYLGSYVARAKTLSRGTVRIVTSMLLQWVEAYLDGREREVVTHEDDMVVRYGPFYGVCQALFYIFCFRWRELQGIDDEEEDEGDLVWMPGVEVLHRAIMSRLNPLKYCAPVVVNQFALITDHFNMFYCDERNVRTIRTRNEKAYSLDAYFPFDPYQLSLSMALIDEMYNTWQRPPGMRDGDDEDDDDDMASEASDSSDEYDDEMSC